MLGWKGTLPNAHRASLQAGALGAEHPPRDVTESVFPSHIPEKRNPSVDRARWISGCQTWLAHLKIQTSVS